MDKAILEFLKDGHTWKIVEVAYGIGSNIEDLIKPLIRLDTLGFIELDIVDFKFVRLNSALYESETSLVKSMREVG
jgi:hypothetical protein